MGLTTRQRRCGGMTFIEILISCLLLSGTVVGVLYLLHAGFVAIENRSGATVALQDAASVIETMRTLQPFNATTLAAAYPDNGLVPGFTNLSNQTVRVRYANLAVRPITVYVAVTWQGHGGRILTEELTALLAAR